MPLQKLGNAINRPKMIIIEPDKNVQMNGGICINAELTFKRKVKLIKDIASEIIMVSTFLNRCKWAPVEADGECRTELPIMIGRRGSTQGARTVSIPAKKAIKKSIILSILFAIPPNTYF